MLLRRFDDSSSMSSVSSATTATTSSSMSSSTCGELADLLGQIHAKERGGSNVANGKSPRKEKEMNGHQAASSGHPSSSNVKCSPRKHNVKKADSSIQTESASALSSNTSNSNSSGSNSLYGWKKYLQEHSLKNPGSGPPQGSPTKIAIVSSVQSADEGRSKESERSPRSKSSGSKGSSHVYSNGSGRAVAVIRANTATAPARSSSHSKGTPRNSSAREYKPGQSRGYQNEIYSDTECMNSAGKSYPFCLTSQVLQANAGNTGGRDYGESRDRLSGIYGQVYTPWMSRQLASSGQYASSGLPRNALTEAESMESLASLSQLTGRPGMPRTNGTDHTASMGSPMKTSSGLGPLMSGRKPRIHAASPVSHSGRLRKCKENENGEIFSSSLSLLSNASTMPSGEDRYSQEIRKLKRELEQSNEKVATLTSQLNTNVHMIAAFEQSLLAITARLQQQTALSEHKDSELKMLKMLVDELNECRKNRDTDGGHRNGRSHGSGHSSSKKDHKSSKKAALARRHTFAIPSDEQRSPLSRHKSSEQIICSNGEQIVAVGDDGKRRPKKEKQVEINQKNQELINGQQPIKSGGWFRSSLTRAFRKNQKHGNLQTKLRSGSYSESEMVSDHDLETSSLPSSPVTNRKVLNTQPQQQEPSIGDELRQELATKDRELTDLRLESLASAAQLDSLNDTLNDLRKEIAHLRAENKELHTILSIGNVQAHLNAQQAGGKSSLNSSRSSSMASVSTKSVPTPTEGQI